ncbi:MAG TPA: DUF4157 domain-containing protein [Longimicrobiaceae bacterium]
MHNRKAHAPAAARAGGAARAAAPAAAPRAAAPREAAASAAAALALPGFERATRGRSSPLPFRAEMEAAFGEDFSGVRAYTGRAGEVLPAGARALAAHEAIAFADRAPGRRTVAHELAHVVQARNAGAAAPPQAASRPGDADEREARKVGRTVAAGGAGRVRLAAGAALHGDWIDDVDDVRRAGQRALHTLAGPCAGLAAADAFVAHGRYGPQDVLGGGGLGGFTAFYDPLDGDGVLTVQLRTAVRFHDSLTVSPGGAVVPGLTTPAFRRLAARLSALPRARRAEAVARYQWTPAERGNDGTWISTLVPLVRDAWSGQHRFFLNLPHHEWIGAQVRIDVQAEDRERTPADHMQLDAWKVPETESLEDFGLHHQVHMGSDTDPRDQTMQLASTNLQPKYDMLRLALPFAPGSAAVVGRARELADRWIGLMNGAGRHPAHQETSVVVDAHASAAEGASAAGADLARRRAEAVRDYLSAHGFRDVAGRVTLAVRDPAGSAPADRRVDLVADGGERRIVALHEFGHAFGLDDEYSDPRRGRPLGAEPQHDEMARQMTDMNGARLPGAVVEQNAGVMSWGNQVRPRHYATFHHALTRVTSQFEWALGTRSARKVAEDACTAAGGTPGAPPGSSGTGVSSAGVPEAPDPPAGSAAPAPSP